MKDFRRFLQSILQIGLPKPKKPFRMPRKIVMVKPTAKWDDYLDDGKPIKFKKGKIERRKK